MTSRPRPDLSYRRAAALLRMPGRKLTVRHLKHGPEYSVTAGGRVSSSTAKRLLEQRREVDPGLFPGSPQAWRLRR